MEAKEFDFYFWHTGRKFTGSLQIMKSFKTRMYRVKVNKIESKHGEIFIFYEVNEKDKRFFYFPIGGLKEAMAESILKELKNY